MELLVNEGSLINTDAHLVTNFWLKKFQSQKNLNTIVMVSKVDITECYETGERVINIDVLLEWLLGLLFNMFGIDRSKLLTY
jgi:hypothetical protein